MKKILLLLFICTGINAFAGEWKFNIDASYMPPITSLRLNRIGENIDIGGYFGDEHHWFLQGSFGLIELFDKASGEVDFGFDYVIPVALKGGYTIQSKKIDLDISMKAGYAFTNTIHSSPEVEFNFYTGPTVNVPLTHLLYLQPMISIKKGLLDAGIGVNMFIGKYFEVLPMVLVGITFPKGDSVKQKRHQVKKGPPPKGNQIKKGPPQNRGRK